MKKGKKDDKVEITETEITQKKIDATMRACLKGIGGMGVRELEPIVDRETKGGTTFMFTLHLLNSTI